MQEGSETGHHLIASQEVLELLQASFVLVVVVVEQVLATLDASWAGERGIREAVPRLEEDPERDSTISESRSAKEGE